MLDVISGGRLVAGFPVGTPMDTNFCYGQIPALTRDKYREAHELIMKAWASDEPFAFDGKYNQLRWVHCWPKPIQQPHPPIYIPGGGSIETWDFCLDYDYNYSYLSFYGYLRGKSLLDGYWERVAKRGKDESPYRAAFAQIICVADTDAEAERLYAEHCLYFFNRCLHVFPPFADPAGYRTMATSKYGALAQLTAARQKIRENLTWKQLVEERFIIAGSPETVRQQLEECIKGLHIGHLFCLFHNGNMPDWKTRHSSKLFAEKVMPHLRDMWREWKHDERWWMHPMDDRIRPEERQPGAAKIGAESAMKWQTIETKKGTRCRVLEGGSGAPLVFFHGAGGLLRDNPFLDQLAQGHHVFAPEWPGYGESTGEELLEDMLDFTLHGWDLVEALGLKQPSLAGHSMGGMIAAEMACVAPHDLAKLVLVSPAGLWMDEHPIPDIFALLPHQIAEVLFHDPQQGQALLTGGADLSDMEALKDFYIGSQRRSLAGRSYTRSESPALEAPLSADRRDLVLWGGSDRLIVPAYAARWKTLIPTARVEVIDGAATCCRTNSRTSSCGPWEIFCKAR